MYAQLGTIIFEQLLGFESFESSYGMDYARHALIEGKPRLQRVGAKLDEHSISIRLHESFCAPEREIERLKTACDEAQVLTFITGSGRLLGDFVIETVSVSRTDTDASGNIINAVASLALLEFVAPDKLGAKKDKARQEAFANSANRPQVVEPLALAPAQLQPAAFMEGVTATKVEASKVNESVETAEANPGKRAVAMQEAGQALSRMDNRLNELNDALLQADNGLENTTDIGHSVNSLQSLGTTLKGYTDVQDVDGAVAANRNLQREIRKLSAVCAPVAALTAQRAIGNG